MMCTGQSGMPTTFAGDFGLRPRLGVLLTVSVPSVDDTLTKSATKTVFFQYSKYTYFGGQCGVSLHPFGT